MRFFARTPSVYYSVRPISRQFNSTSKRRYAHKNNNGSTADRHGQEQLRYQSLGDYLQRLPRGIRDLLLWSPAIATAYFMLYKQSVYYYPSHRRRLLSRPTDTTTTVDTSTTVAGNSPSVKENEATAQLVSVQLDGTAGTVVNGVLLKVLDSDGGPLHPSSSSSSSSVTPNSDTSSHTTAPTWPPIPPFSTGAISHAPPVVRLVRDGQTGKVVGYAAV